MVHQSGSIALIRASPIRARLCRALLASALLAGSLGLAGCNTDIYQLPTRAMKELSPEMLALLGQKGMPRESPILVRIFKEESELEVWKQDTTGRFEMLKVYPICRWSGELGPKVREGDRQAPEGFYTITPALMNPNSSYYLAINTGFPNAYDRANGRSGAFLMIHGDCSSRGCYAMTDEQIGEIYSLARESFLGGQQSFQIQAYPFRMTAANLARHRTNPNMPFWRMIKEGNDHFEVTHMEPKVDVCDRHYVFDAQSPANSAKPLAFNPTGHCPAFEVSPQLAALARDKEQHDEAQFTQLARFNAPVAPIKTGTDGGSNRVFIAQIENSSRTVDSEGHVHVVLPPAGSVPETTGAVADNSASQPSLASRLFGRMFGSKSSGDSTRVASADANAGTQERSGGFFSNLFSSRSSNSPQQANTAGAALAPESPSGAGAA
jgi:murein L,D-transpeptidase YafK